MNAIATNDTSASTHYVVDVQPADRPANDGLSARPFNFSLLLADYYVAMNQLFRITRQMEGYGQLSQWNLQQSSLVTQKESIDKTFSASLTSGICDIFSGVATATASGVGYRFGGGQMGLEVGSQLGNGIGSSVSGFVRHIAGGAMTKEAADAQMRADFARNCSEAHGRLVSTLGEDASGYRQEYLTAMRTMAQLYMEINKSIDITK